MEIGSSTRCYVVRQVPCFFSWNTREFGVSRFHQIRYVKDNSNLKFGCQKWTQCRDSVEKRLMNSLSWRAHRVPVSVEESSPIESEPTNEEPVSDNSPEDPLAKPLSSDELKALLADTERANLLRKLSEANQQNRFLKRQLHARDESLVEFKAELANMELDFQALIKLAEEVANSTIPEGTRKINGKYIQSYLLSRLEAVIEKLREQIKDVGVVQSKEVSLFWYGVAESVQVMGSFDGWSQGEYLSQEYTGSYTKFSTTLFLRPGRYEIKFLVDGEWQLSSEFPTAGEGMMENNLLVVV